MDSHCTFSVDESDRVLDRLAALEQIIPAEVVEQAILSVGLVPKRSWRDNNGSATRKVSESGNASAAGCGVLRLCAVAFDHGLAGRGPHTLP